MADGTDTTTDLVSHVTVFPRGGVLAVLDAAAASSTGVELVKDDGAYLIAWAADQKPVVAYGVGHVPPPRTESSAADLQPGSAWSVAREFTREVFGGDDFALEFPAADVRAALGDDGVRVVTIVSGDDVPAEYRSTIGPDRVYRLVDATLAPPAAT